MTMNTIQRIRPILLRVMYGATALVATLIGGLILFAPAEIVPDMHDAWNRGILGSMELTFGLLAVAGLFFPYRFIPVLLFQLVYKSVWLGVVVLPMALAGTLGPENIAEAVVFLVFVIGDAVAIPFSSLLGREPGSGQDLSLGQVQVSRV
jgi:hypothetical protein